MEEQVLHKFHQSIAQHKDALQQWLNSGASNMEPYLGGASVKEVLDLELAAKVQKQLLPSCIPSIKGTQIAVKNESARIVGGDYHDFFSLKNGYQGFAVGDVMGKGLPASIHPYGGRRIQNPLNT